MIPNNEGYERDCPALYITKLFDICIKPKQWRPIRDELAFDQEHKYVQLTPKESD